MTPDNDKSLSTVAAAWAALFVAAAVCVLAESYYPYFPGDVATARWVQSLLPQDLAWAQTVSRSAEFPRLFIILALIAAISWAFAGWRSALLSILSLAGMLALGLWLAPVIGRPRPSPDLVRVIKPFPGYGFPSLFALRYAATFGFLAILAARKGRGAARTVVLIVCATLFILGWCARVALAAHWPSDVIVSYYLGLLWAAFLIRFGSKGSTSYSIER